MSNFDYTKAKFILFQTTQFGKNTSFNSKEDIAKFIGTGANGYILMPKINNNVNNVDNVDTIEHHYGINDINTYTGAMEDCINKLYDFAYKICQLQPDANIWIGTPEINSNNVNSLIINGNADITAKTLTNYTIGIKNKFNTGNGLQYNMWNKNIKGFFYNQECIYTIDSYPMDYNYLSNNPEYSIMNSYSYYVHNSMPINNDPSKGYEEIKKDLIWIPYLQTETSGNLTEAENFKRVCAIIERTTCFDCAFLQPHLMDVIGNILDNADNNIEIKNEYIDEINKGIANINVICNAIENGYLSYRDGIRILEDKYISNSELRERKCIYGGEYEYSSYINKDKYPEINKYNNFDKYVGIAPLLYYWQGDNLNLITQKIRTSYNQEFTVNSDVLTTDTLSYSSIYKENTALNSVFNSLNEGLTSPTSKRIVLDVTDLKLTSKDEENLKGALSTIYMSDYPERYWTFDFITSFNYTDDKIMSTINVSVYSEFDEEDEMENFENFENDIASILNSLSIDTLTTEEDKINAFIKIHDWLITNVEYSAYATYSYWDCAFAINENYRKATSRGFAMSLATLCKSSGIPCLVCTGTKDSLTHYWNYVNLNNKWWFVDASLNIPTDNDKYKYKYFLRAIPNSYCPTLDLPYVELTSDYLVNFGDINQDGEITSSDQALAYQYVLNKTGVNITPLGLIAGDVNGSGDIEMADTTYIQNKALNKAYILPIINKLQSYI